MRNLTVAAADGVRFARVRREINFLLTFETAPFICKRTVLQDDTQSIQYQVSFKSLSMTEFCDI